MDYENLIPKDPELTLFPDLIMQFFGDKTKVVCVIRDPCSVIASMHEVESKKGITTEIDIIEIAASIFNYYWRIHNSDLFKNGMVHIIRFENIVKKIEEDFARIDQFLGFKISRDGFGKSKLEFDKSDPTYSSNYGQLIQASSSLKPQLIPSGKVSEIRKMFGGYNLRYNLWLG